MKLLGNCLENNFQSISKTLPISFQTLQNYFFSFVTELVIALLAIGLAKLILYWSCKAKSYGHWEVIIRFVCALQLPEKREDVFSSIA
jgi:hypothetical protein